MSGWVKLENTLSEKPKVLALSTAAFQLWVFSLCYCSKGETDGHVPMSIAKHLPGSKPRLLAELVTGGMLEPVEDGYLVHDYLDYNPSKAEIEQKRQGARRRMANWRSARSDAAGDAAVTPLHTANERDSRDRTAVVVNDGSTTTPVAREDWRAEGVQALREMGA